MTKAVGTTSESNSTAPVYTTTESSLKQVFTVCSRFYEFLIEDGGAAANPFRMLKKSNRFTDDTFDVTSGRALTPLQWDYVMDG